LDKLVNLQLDFRWWDSVDGADKGYYFYQPPYDHGTDLAVEKVDQLMDTESSKDREVLWKKFKKEMRESSDLLKWAWRNRKTLFRGRK